MMPLDKVPKGPTLIDSPIKSALLGHWAQIKGSILSILDDVVENKITGPITKEANKWVKLHGDEREQIRHRHLFQAALVCYSTN